MLSKRWTESLKKYLSYGESFHRYKFTLYLIKDGKNTCFFYLEHSKTNPRFFRNKDYVTILLNIIWDALNQNNISKKKKKKVNATQIQIIALQMVPPNLTQCKRSSHIIRQYIVCSNRRKCHSDCCCFTLPPANNDEQTTAVKLQCAAPPLPVPSISSSAMQNDAVYICFDKKMIFFIHFW